ncbi:Winged helix-turn-helix DNA-binding [Lachnospiraceae bacterium KHCPX20]|nr:Winged helix-turn-helix DNA-binding [Lachnospiraceae bacterium KHCPX20]
MENALRVNMYRALPEDEKQAIKASDSRNMFAEYMSQHGASTTAEMAEFSGLSPQRTRAILSKMVEDGIIIAEGANRARKYRLQ